MPREDAIEVEGTVVETLPETRCRVELPNQHRIVAHVPGRARFDFGTMRPGDRVRVRMSPYDMSKGSIVARGTNG